MLIDFRSLSTVYVFVGGQWALDDFLLCLQDKKLLENGEYMVVSVNDEFYNTDLKNVQDNSKSKFIFFAVGVKSVNTLTLEWAQKNFWPRH